MSLPAVGGIFMASIVPYKLKSGKKLWRYQIRAGINPATGKEKKVGKRGFRTRAAAKEAAKEAEYLYNIGELDVETSDMLIKDYLDEWITHYKIDVKPGTIKVHTYNINHYIIPHIGFTKLTEYTLSKHQKFINKLYDDCKLATSTIRLINGTLHNAMKKAKRMELIKNNPCEGAEFRKKVVSKQEELVYFNQKQASIFLEQAKKERAYIFYYIFLACLNTGLRISEAMALQWSDINMEKKEIDINKCRLYRQENKDQIVFGPPKTNSGFRTLIMSDELYDSLIELKKIQRSNNLKNGFKRKYPEYDFVYCFSDARPIAHRTLSGAFDRITTKCNGDVPKITIHDMRHTFAIMLREAGVTLEDIKDILGHKNIEATFIYASFSPVANQNAMKKYNEYKKKLIVNM